MIIDGQKYINEKELASLYDMSLRWVRRIRYNDKKFPYYKLNGRVFFNEFEVNEWLKTNMKPSM
jgi:predicted DNA-binding transcriptional regulator AlpA